MANSSVKSSVKVNSFNFLFLICFSVYIFLTLNPWFTWYIPLKILFVLFIFLLFFLYCLSLRGKIYLKKRKLYFIFLFTILIIYTYLIKKNLSLSNVFLCFYMVFPFLIYFSIDFYSKVYIKNLIIKMFSFVLFISFSLYLVIVFMKVSIPYSVLMHPEKNAYSTSFKNYFLLITYNMPFRFQSIFTEPGHLGMILSFLLYLGKYDFKKKENIFFLICSLFTFSLASYLLIFAGMYIYSLSKTKHIFRNVLFLVFFLVVCFLAMNQYYKNNPDTLISKLIFSRLQFHEKTGISGNNRTAYSFNEKYLKLTFKDKIWGLGAKGFSEYFDLTGTSYKTYIAEYGYIGLFLIFLTFGVYALKYRSKYVIGCFLLYALSFLQRPYILWPIETYLFLLTIDLNTAKEVIKK